ncbi:hypothetical protein OG21DRAFT_534225 [Imleria badia]|nr:hypothetical protein OG21DRAFT_534225 [Imleria badia]
MLFMQVHRLSHANGRATNIVHDKQPLVSPGVVQTTPGALGHTQPSYANVRNTNIARKMEPRVLTVPSSLRTTPNIPRASYQITWPRYTEDRDANFTRDKQPLVPPDVAQTTQHTGNTSYHSAGPSDANIVRDKKSLASPGVVQTTQHTAIVSYHNAGPSSAEQHDSNIVHNMQPPTSPDVVQTSQGTHNAPYHRPSYADERDPNRLCTNQLLASLNVECGPHGPDTLVCGATLNYNEETLLENHRHPQPSNVIPDTKRKVDADWDSDTDEKPLAKIARTNSENICSSPRNQQREVTRRRG